MNGDYTENGIPAEAKRSKSGTALRIAPVLAAAILFTIALVLSRAPEETRESSPWEKAMPDTVIMMGPEVVEALREVSVLDVLQMDASQPISRDLEDTIFGIRLGNVMIEAEYSFMISAGIDLAEVSHRDIAIDFPGGLTRITATLPWPRVTGIYCINRSYSVSESIVFRKSDEIIAAALAQMDIEAEARVEERIMGMGLVDRAAEAGRSKVEELLLSFGADLVLVRYR